MRVCRASSCRLFWCVDTEGSFHPTNRLRQEVCARLHVKVEGLLFRRGAACSYCRSTYTSISFSSITFLPCHSTLSLSRWGACERTHTHTMPSPNMHLQHPNPVFLYFCGCHRIAPILLCYLANTLDRVSGPCNCQFYGCTI